jgi:adenylosuccinate synthase
MIDVLLGLQWGDEGKGKVVDFLAPKYDIIARFQGGPNAGNTLYLGDKKVVLHTIPSGVFHKNLLNVIGNGVVIYPYSFKLECEEIESLGVQLTEVMLISERAHLILPTHKALDKASELAKGKNKIDI